MYELDLIKSYDKGVIQMEIVSALEVCLEVTRKIEDCFNKHHALERQIETFNEEISKYEARLTKLTVLRTAIGSTLIVFFVYMFLFIVIGDRVSYDIPMSEDTVYTIFGGMVIGAGILSIVSGILYTLLFKKRNSKKRNEAIRYKANTERGLEDLTQPLNELLGSPENELCKSLIPPDYRQAAIIEKFIYFFRNGHVTTMQEAVIAYDKFRHEKKMERYASEAADIARIAANNTANMQRSLNELEAIAAYNTYLNMKNNS